MPVASRRRRAPSATPTPPTTTTQTTTRRGREASARAEGGRARDASVDDDDDGDGARWKRPMVDDARGRGAAEGVGESTATARGEGTTGRRARGSGDGGGATDEDEDEDDAEARATTRGGVKRKKRGKRCGSVETKATVKSPGRNAEGTEARVLFEDSARAELLTSGRRARERCSTPTTVSSDMATMTTYASGSSQKGNKLMRFYIDGDRRRGSTSAPKQAKTTADGHLQYALRDPLTSEYRIVSLLGEGTFGRVFECWDFVTESTCAVKVIRNVKKYRDASMVEIEVLKALVASAVSGDVEKHHCIRLKRAFNYQGHVCMVFDKYGPSLYDLMRGNSYKPYHPKAVQRITHKLIEAVRYVHSLGMVHTDLKPENVLLVSNTLVYSAEYTIPQDFSIRLIDFGSTTFINRHHSAVVSTRHYRAPEIILGLGWSYSCDMWSIGCVTIELLTGEALFQTHDNVEHLKMMQRALQLDGFPRSMLMGMDAKVRTFFFDKHCSVKWPNETTDHESITALNKTGVIDHMVRKHIPAVKPRNAFLSLLSQMMKMDPKTRISAEAAVYHRFFLEDVDPPPKPKK